MISKYTSLNILNSSKKTNLMMQMTDPLSKLCGVGNGGRQKDVVNVVWQQDDCFLPHNASFCTQTNTDLSFFHFLLTSAECTLCVCCWVWHGTCFSAPVLWPLHLTTVCVCGVGIAPLVECLTHDREVVGLIPGRSSGLVSWCFEPSQPQGSISGRVIFLLQG